MRAVDPTIKIVAVGDTLSADANPASRRWNETVLREAGDLINYLSFHLYQPRHNGWHTDNDPEALVSHPYVRRRFPRSRISNGWPS